MSKVTEFPNFQGNLCLQGAKSFDPIRGYVFSFCFGVGAWSQDRFVQKNVWRSKKKDLFWKCTTSNWFEPILQKF